MLSGTVYMMFFGPICGTVGVCGGDWVCGTDEVYGGDWVCGTGDLSLVFLQNGIEWLLSTCECLRGSTRSRSTWYSVNMSGVLINTCNKFSYS